MNQETMTIHKALVELKTIDSRIFKKIHATAFCTAKKHREKKVNGVTVEAFQAAAVEGYQSICDLIARRNAIKAAVAQSNAVTQIKVGDETYTVAQAISLKQHGMELLQELANEILSQYSKAQRAITLAEQGLETSADAYIATLYGGKENAKAADPAEVEKARQAYIDNITVELVQGISGDGKTTHNVKEVADKLQDLINTFYNDIDAALSVSNAVTTITVQY